jgi:hypothetical protein
MDSRRDNLAEPESLLGMLQRGRGKGYLVALETARGWSSRCCSNTSPTVRDTKRNGAHAECNEDVQQAAVKRLESAL